MSLPFVRYVFYWTLLNSRWTSKNTIIFTNWTHQKNWETVEAENSRYLVFKIHSLLFAWTVSPQKSNNHNTKTTTTTPKPLVLSDVFSSLSSRSRFVTTKTTSTTATVSPPMLCSKHVEGHKPSGRKLFGEEGGSTTTPNPNELGWVFTTFLLDLLDGGKHRFVYWRWFVDFTYYDYLHYWRIGFQHTEYDFTRMCFF